MKTCNHCKKEVTKGTYMLIFLSCFRGKKLHATVHHACAHDFYQELTTKREERAKQGYKPTFGY